MSFASQLNQTVVHYAKTGYDAYGSQTYGTATTYKARVQLTNKKVELPNHDIIDILAIVFMPATANTVNTNDRIVYDSVNYKVFTKKPIIGGSSAIHHLEFELTKWT